MPPAYTPIGTRVLGRDLDDVVGGVRVGRPGREAAVPGAADVVADPIRGKGTSRSASSRGPPARGERRRVNDPIETALDGKVATTTVEGRERHPSSSATAARATTRNRYETSRDGPRTCRRGGPSRRDVA